MQQQQAVLLPPQSAHHSHAPERPSVDQGALQASPRPPGNVRMSSPAHGSTPLALRLIASWSAARNPDATPQTPPQVQLPNSWLDSSAHSSAFSVVPGGGESREVPPTATSERACPRTVRNISGGGSCGSLESDGTCGSGGSPGGVTTASGNPPLAALDEGPRRLKNNPQSEEVPPPPPHQPLEDRRASAGGASAAAEDTVIQNHGQSDTEGGAGASDGGAAAGPAATSNQQDAVQNLDEIVAALPPGPIHVTVAVRVGAGGGRRPRGAARAAEEDTRSGYMRGHARGVFDVPRYLAGRDCIHNGNKWMSRSNFEKVGGSKMAKWYRSIRVLPDLEPLGEWLERHGVPVAKGPARRSRKRAAESGDGDEQLGDGPDDDGAAGSQEEEPMQVDTEANVAPVPNPPAAPAPAAALTPLGSLPPLAPLPPQAAAVAAAAAAAAAAARSAAAKAAGSASVATGHVSHPGVDRPVEIPLDRKFLQALLNTLSQEQLLSRGALESAVNATAEEEHDHGTYGPPGAYVDYSAYGGTRNQGAMRTGAGASAVSRGAGAPGTAEAKLLAAAQAMLGSDATTISAIAAAMAAVRYHRSGDLPPGELPTDMPRLRWRALHRSQSSSDPMSSSPTLHLDLQDLQHARDLEDGHENPNRGSRQALRQELQLQQQQQHQLQQQLQQQLHQQLQQQLEQQLERQLEQEQQHLLRRIRAQQQQQLLAEEEDYYYGGDNDAQMEEDEEDVMSRMGGMGDMELDLARARAEAAPQMSLPLPPQVRRAHAGVPMPYSTRAQRYRTSESSGGDMEGPEAPPSVAYLAAPHAGGAAGRGAVGPGTQPRSERRLPLQPLTLPPAPPSPPSLESAAALARGLAALQGLDVAAAAGLGPAHEHVPQAAMPAPHLYPMRASEDVCFKPRWNGLGLYYFLMASGRENRF
ncbi:hypothetical protein Vafri_2333 [Volvox africanus]|nr:hypothetical protein Vafri_2333 [Volvox africanus]